MNRKRPEDLRSHRWLGVNDLRSFGHRSRLRQFGYDSDDWGGRPVIAIINTWSEINACHAHLRARAENVKRGVLQAGGFPIELPAMSDDIPFDKSFDLAPDIVDQVASGVRRVLANNPSPFTFKGTLSYIVGQGHVAIIDPGPLDEVHIAALLDAVRGETVTHIFVTHTHRDHSPAVPRIKAATGAVVLAEGPHRPARPLNIGEAPRLDASNDTEFQPDRALADGEVVTGRGWTIEAVTTPGHTANHMNRKISSRVAA